MFLLLRSSFDAPPSTPPPPGRPQSTRPGEGSAPASPGRIRRVRTSPWISDGAHAKDLPCKIFPCRYLNKSCSYLLVIKSLWENLCYFIFCSNFTLIVWREEQEGGHQNTVQQELEVNSLGKEKVVLCLSFPVMLPRGGGLGMRSFRCVGRRGLLHQKC